MSTINSLLGGLIRKLKSRAPLAESDEAALLAVPHVVRRYEPAAYLLREGEQPRRSCSFLLSGYAFRQKLTVQGTRQIISLHMAGDLLDLQQLYLNVSDHNIQALTRLEVVELDRATLQALVLERPAIARAMWVDALVEASIFREWVLNVGRRDARARIAHLICEFAVRLEAAGLAGTGSYELPLTQEQLGDATGLTSVHVNRTLRALEADGLIQRDRRHITFADRQRLAEAADFSAIYLHLDQTHPPA
jgi:CRP-like cAMP-binding protein